MDPKASLLVVIPARGGSKGIPRKNLRPLAGKPLLAYAIGMARSSVHEPFVCVTSDDAEILATARNLGAVPIERPGSLAEDAVTLDPVIHHAYVEAERLSGRRFDLVATVQPTSPLLRVSSFDRAVATLLGDPGLDTVISAMEDAHLSWRRDGERFVPNYEKRLNRQQLEPRFRETGGFLVTRAACMGPRARIGASVSLQVLHGAETIDIDDYDDWNRCEYHIRKKRVLFVVAGYPEIGLGHVYNSLALAHEILNHEVMFLVDARSSLALEKIGACNYPARMQEGPDLVEEIAALAPDVVINDRLDTDADYVGRLKGKGFLVINFEDLGEGAGHADLVVNAIYPERFPRRNHHYGHRYMVLRDEFMREPRAAVRDEVREVLVTFGGVDPANNTRRVLAAIDAECVRRGIRIKVIAGFGYSNYASIASFRSVEVLRDVSNIAEHMASADIVFTSAGRTTYEVSAIGTPAIVLAQNERELTHFFASAEYGFLNLGLGSGLGDEAIRGAFVGLVEDAELRRNMASLMGEVDLRASRRNVIKLINQAIEES